MKKTALLSVSNREGLVEFAKELSRLGYDLLVTQGTGRALKEAGVETLSIEEYTAQKEILGGRVKTLHPKIYAGILARREVPEDLQELETHGIRQIDVVAVNLYPFIQNVGTGKSTREMVELVDIGGPSMIRAAAKNFSHVLPVIDPADYGRVVKVLAGEAEDSQSFRQELAAKVFAFLNEDAGVIARYFGSKPNEGPSGEQYRALSLSQAQTLRYGENPHQTAGFYLPLAARGKFPWVQHGGKELSYNNILDTDATTRLLRSVLSLASGQGLKGAVIIKHLNPCGVALGETLLGALKDAKACDPRSHFGGVLGFTHEVDTDTAQEIREDFCEIVIAPSFTQDALTILRSSKNLRVLEMALEERANEEEVRSALGGYLVQSSDRQTSGLADFKTVSAKTPSQGELDNLLLAWTVCAHVKSNAIVVAKDRKIIAVGAGQMSRIDSVEVALLKADVHGHDLKGAAAASDAFFPFPDALERLAERGITAIVAPSGAKRDEEAIRAANERGVALLFAPDRHFRH